MQTEHFKSEREFKRKFPSKIFICSGCGAMIPEPDFCKFCNESSNKLFLINKNLYSYQIGDSEPKTIFRPLELQTEE